MLSPPGSHCSPGCIHQINCFHRAKCRVSAIVTPFLSKIPKERVQNFPVTVFRKKKEGESVTFFFSSTPNCVRHRGEKFRVIGVRCCLSQDGSSLVKKKKGSITVAYPYPDLWLPWWRTPRPIPPFRGVLQGPPGKFHFSLINGKKYGQLGLFSLFVTGSRPIFTTFDPLYSFEIINRRRWVSFDVTLRFMNLVSFKKILLKKSRIFAKSDKFFFWIS